MSRHAASITWPGAWLREIGFRSAAPADGWHRQDMVLGVSRGWLTAARKGPSGKTDPLSGFRDRPGLWKPADASRGGDRGELFELPLDALQAGLMDQEPDQALREVLEWILAAAGESLSGSWQPPDRSRLASLLDPAGLVLQWGEHVCQGELVAGDSRLALKFRILEGVPETLPAARRAWLRALLLDAQARWRMVRISAHPPSGPLEAAIDLTGAPHFLLESLVPVSLDALRWVTGWLVESAAFLADGAIECPGLEAQAMRA